MTFSSRRPDMRKIWLIVKREYLNGVRTKAFLITTVFLPLLGLGFIAMISFLVNRQPSRTLRLAIVDNAGGLGPSISDGLQSKLPSGQPEFKIVQTIERPSHPDRVEDDLGHAINAGALDGYVLVPEDLSQPVELHSRNPGNPALMARLTAAVNRAIILQQLRARGIRVDHTQDITGAADLKVFIVGRSGRSMAQGQSLGVAIALVIVLYVSLVAYGVLMMRSVLEEKTTRTMEVLISSVRPFELLAGKIIGVAGMAFTQLSVWGICLGLLFTYGALASGAFAPGSPLSGLHVPGSLVVYAVFFFLGGYFLYSAMFAAIGSACSTEQDAQQLQWIAMAPLVFSVVSYGLVLSDPGSTASIVISEIPFFSPVLMPLRISVRVLPLWQIALAFVLLWLTTIGTIYASGKIYRIGVLMYGKRPTLPELARWLRYS